MATTNRRFVPTLLACAVAGAAWLPQGAAAQAGGDAAAAGSMATPVTGTLAPAAATRAAGPGAAAASAPEAVVFAGQALVTARVIRDTTFGAPPVLELIVDLGRVTAKGARSGQAYQVEGQAILHRPLQPFEQVEVGVTFAPQGNPLQARSAVASFGVHYTAAKGVTTTPMTIGLHPPSPS